METDIINRAKAAITEAFPRMIKYKVIHFGSIDIPGEMSFGFFRSKSTREVYVNYERIMIIYTSIEKFVIEFIDDILMSTKHNIPIKYLRYIENLYQCLEVLNILPLPIREAVSEYFALEDTHTDIIYKCNSELVESVRRRILYS